MSARSKQKTKLKPKEQDAPEESTGGLGVSIKGISSGVQDVTTRQDALGNIFNTKNTEVAERLLVHCLKALRADEGSEEEEYNDERLFMVGAVNEIAPRDGLEAMLAVQMAATHVAVIRSARWLANTENIAQVQAHYSGYNKLTRTFTAQMEALRKHRNGGKQTVTVQHVNVEDGGQAIVGNVETGGRADGKK